MGRERFDLVSPLLRWLGVEPAAMSWCVGDIDTPEWSVTETGLPEFVTTPPPGRSLAQMLVAGEIDVLLSPPRPRDFHPENGPITRLFPDSRPIEEQYARAFRIWPPQHLVLLRRETWLRDKFIARSLTNAFIENNDVFANTQRSLPYASPWLEADLDASDALLGPDAHADGLEQNRSTMEVFCKQAHRSGITSRLVSVDEYFAEYLES